MEKRVLVTGGAGYVGRPTVEALRQRGFEVIVADRVGSTFQLDGVKVIEEPIFTDDKDVYEKFGRPDVLIHLAWQDGFVHQADSHIENLPLHYRFIKNMVEGGLRHVIGMGSMHEVGYFEGAIDEDTPTNPQSPYGVAKDALRKLMAITAKNNDATYQWVRAFYITGDEGRSQSVFRKIVDADARGDEKFPFNSGKNKYDFIDVHELGTQIAAVASQTEINGVINCCSGTPVGLGDRVERFIDENELAIKLDYGVFPDRPYDSPAVWGDNSKILRVMSSLAMAE